MTHLIYKDALVAEIEKLKGKVSDDSSYCNGWQHSLRMLEIELNTLEVKDPYEQCIQYDSINAGIQAHAVTYSFNIESKLFNQLSKEQQKLWRKEIEQACISGGEMGYSLAKDPRYKENLEVKEVDLQSEIDHVWNNTSDNFSEDGWKEFEDIAKHFFELGMEVGNPLTVKDIKKIYHLVNEVSDDLGVRAMYVNIYQEALKRFKAQKGEKL